MLYDVNMRLQGYLVLTGDLHQLKWLEVIINLGSQLIDLGKLKYFLLRSLYDYETSRRKVTLFLRNYQNKLKKQN